MSADSVVPDTGALTVWPSDKTAAPLFVQGPKDKNGKPTAPQNPQELNRYSYALNNPVKNTDPTGHCVGPVIVVCVVVVGVVLVAGALGAVSSSPNSGVRWGDYDWTDWSIPWLKADTNDNDEPRIPDKPVGSLTTPNEKFWERKGVDPHAVKDAVVGGKLSEYDLHVDKDKNVWVKRKGASDSKAIYVGPLDQVIEDYPIEEDDS